MSIDNSREFLALAASEGSLITDHLLFGRNREIAPGTYTPNYETGEYNSVTFAGTAGSDTLIGGGGEDYTFFLGSAGNDLYGVDFPPETFANAYVDYSNACRGVYVDMSFRGSRTFTDESGDVRTVEIFGQARDGFGGVDSFMEARSPGFNGFSSILGVFGTSHRDVMIGGGGFDIFYGAGGDDLLIGLDLYGGDGNDVLTRRADYDFSGGADGGDGNDLIFGADFIDSDLIGGAGNDRIFAGAGDDGSGKGRYVAVTGNEGNDYVDGGAGDDFIDGGVGRDTLISGAGNDIINPDREEFQGDPLKPTDGARDRILVTRSDVGDFNDVVVARAFETGLDEIRFREAVAGGRDYRLYFEAQTLNEAGVPYRPGQVGVDLVDVQNTVLQIDQNGNGFGDETPDAADYFISVIDVTLTEHGGWLLT